VETAAQGEEEQGEEERRARRKKTTNRGPVSSSHLGHSEKIAVE